VGVSVLWPRFGIGQFGYGFGQLVEVG